MENLPPRPPMLLRQMQGYPHYSILLHNIKSDNPLPVDLSLETLRKLAEKLRLYLNLHPGVKLGYDELVNLNEEDFMHQGGSRNKKTKKTSGKKTSSKKTSSKKTSSKKTSSKKTKSQVGGAKKRKSKKSSKKSSKK